MFGLARNRWITRSLGVVGFGFAIYVAVDAWNDGALAGFGGAWGLVWSIIAAMIAAIASSCSWAVLIGQARNTAPQYLILQLSKYAPSGGFLHAFGQIALTPSGRTRAHVSAMFLTHALVHVMSSLFVGCAIGAAVGVFTTPVRFSMGVVAAALGIFGVRLVQWSLRGVAQWKRVEILRVEAASLTTIRTAAVWAALAITTAGLAFWNVIRFLSPSVSFLGAISAFSIAWTIGFLALPFPAGAGIREIILTTFGLARPNMVVAASVVHRLTSLVGDISLAIVASFLHPRTDEMDDSNGSSSDE